MKNYLVNELVNELNEGRLELIDNEIVLLFEKIDAYVTFEDVKYEDKLRDMQLINAIKSYNDKIKNMIDKLNNVQVSAIENEYDNLVFACEERKTYLIGTMSFLEDKYL